MANNYDRIFKENIESLLLPLLNKLLGLKPPKLAPIDAKMQVTQEAEMDHIRRVVHDDPAQDYGLQIEFHISDEDLRRRNLLHYALFHHITGLPLRQIVIYGGTLANPNHIHQNQLTLSGLDLQYEVIVLKQIPKEQFLHSEIPEEVILAILCDFGEDEPTSVVRQILHNLKRILRKSNRIKKFQKQLLILSRLRKMELIVKTEVEAMTIHYDIETDGLFLKGIEEGLEKGIQEGIEKGIEEGIQKGLEKGLEEGIEKGIELEKQVFVHKLWSLQEFSLEKIALMVDVSHERLLEMLRAQLQAGGQTESEAKLTIEAYQARFL
jgi:hypothetical protein